MSSMRPCSPRPGTGITGAGSTVPPSVKVNVCAPAVQFSVPENVPAVAEFSVASAGVTLAGEEAGEGTPVVLLHGLTATRRYVVMGSRALERSGHRVVTYDARAHGASTGAEDPDAYDYDDLVDDLRAVMDDRGIDRAVLADAVDSWFSPDVD